MSVLKRWIRMLSLELPRGGLIILTAEYRVVERTRYRERRAA